MSVGRSNIKQVADKRRADIEKFLQSLFKMAPEISQSDLVYTFFHPLLRDQQNADIHLRKVRGRNFIYFTINRVVELLQLTTINHMFNKSVQFKINIGTRGRQLIANFKLILTQLLTYVDGLDWMDRSSSSKAKKNKHSLPRLFYLINIYFPSSYDRVSFLMWIYEICYKIMHEI